MPTYVSHMNSPIGRLRLVGDGNALFSLTMEEQRHARLDDAGWQRDDAAFAEVRRQLDAYFEGRRTTFDLPLAPAGTAFQKMVWAALTEIPFGHTENYGELARRIGSPGAARAVGLANGRNPTPDHRALPPRDRRRWLTDRLRWRHRAQAVAAAA